ncbi:winged helix-turn-helix transcriptional regulator [Agrobacterium sp. Ap1]|uniref:MarR family winged helix-turn-helix transcriptional regulator n=1 Tax=Agrobacterium sp. Ap1 TaxID=2815337 RepID=UPI001A90AD6B|nr:MarR family winged helix-turn-helix transcriptional regulator [Agrobacterium sp. Ap1]MBO0140212.1 winged helix-turn-helix transcriptional regulator [Agrobacterium sp. Ap1]
MSKVVNLNYFAALPGRAITDKDLTGLQLRIIAVVAAHDRMGRNGQCCWAGRKAMASRVGCTEGSFSEAMTVLVKRGYIEVEQDTEDARRRGYRVMYQAEQDAAGMGFKPSLNRSADTDPSGGDRSADADASSGDRSAKTDQNAYGQRKKAQINQMIRSATRKPNIFHEVEEDISLKENTPPKSRAFEAENPRSQIIRHWFGKDGMHDGFELLKVLSNLKWQELIGLWRKGDLTDQIRDATCDYAERLRALAD